ncbi:MAG: F0F1 ATP synthase subunit A [Pseudomonadota bacterium]
MPQELSIYRTLSDLTGWQLVPYGHIIGAALVLLIITTSSFIAWQYWKDPYKAMLPTPGFSFSHLYEVITEMILNLLESIVGKDANLYLPLIGSLFIYILLCNLMGIIPGFDPPTSNINTNLPCALIVFFYYNYVGMKKYGVLSYFRKMAGPVLWLAPLIFTNELISHLVRPVSLSVRLFGNMMGDHITLTMFSDFVPILVPTIFMLLGLLIGIIQAFVFCILTMIYISLAKEH